MPAQTHIPNRRFVIAVITLVLVTSAAANLVVTSKLSRSGEQLKDLETRAEQLRLDNQLLEQQVLSQQSLTTIQAQAENLGFQSRPTQLILTPDLPVALSRVE